MMKFRHLKPDHIKLHNTFILKLVIILLWITMNISNMKINVVGANHMNNQILNKKLFILKAIEKNNIF